MTWSGDEVKEKLQESEKQAASFSFQKIKGWIIDIYEQC